jgi:hypothetical protein
MLPVHRDRHTVDVDRRRGQLDAVAERHEPLFEQVDPADVAAAARARLDALVSVGLGVRG